MVVVGTCWSLQIHRTSCPRSGSQLSRVTHTPPLPRPLADSEKLPVQKHRNAETVKSPEKEGVPGVEKKSKKPKKKEKKPKERERERKDKKVRACGWSLGVRLELQVGCGAK